MKIDILTLFPEMFQGFLSSSIIGRAVEKGILDIHIYDIRDFTDNKHRKADDYPFGGGAGLVMMAQPIFSCMEQVLSDGCTAKRIMMTPRGKRFTNDMAVALSSEERIVLICGHYEGIDERVSGIVDEEISIGDYILTGGELPAMILIDSISRFIPGVLGSTESVKTESFAGDLLEYPQYTRPSVFRGMRVPEVLLNGNHKEIAAWRMEQSILKTRKNRPDLYRKYRRNCSKKDKK